MLCALQVQLAVFSSPLSVDVFASTWNFHWKEKLMASVCRQAFDPTNTPTPLLPLTFLLLSLHVSRAPERIGRSLILPYFSRMKRPKSKTKKRSIDNTSPAREQSDGNNPTAANKRRKLDAVPSLDQPVKSKKELRKERKAAVKTKVEADGVVVVGQDTSKSEAAGNRKETAKQKRREENREARRARKEEKERALEARFEQQDQLRQQKSGTEQEPAKKQNRNGGSTQKEEKTKKRKQKTQKESEDYAVYKSIFKKHKDHTTGATTCRLGVRYIDVKLGTGPMVQSMSLINVKYQLRGGSTNGILIDSSKKFSFRLGKGEVIQGWEIGLEGMRQGGVRHLIVPPKAGYGSQDIGAGSGAMLHFDVTLTEIIR